MSLSGKLKSKGKAPAADASGGGASVSSSAGAVGGGSGAGTVANLQNLSTTLNILKNVAEWSDILGPMKAVCGVLEVLVDAEVLVQQNDRDLVDLRQKIERQRDFFQKQVDVFQKRLDVFNGPRNGEFKFDDSEMIVLFRKYIVDLQDLHDKLVPLGNKHHGSKLRIFKKLLTAASTQQDITELSQRLTDSFEELTTSMTTFIATHVAFISHELTELRERFALYQLSLADARGNMHEPCLRGTRTYIINEITIWAAEDNAWPMLALIDPAGTGKSTIATHMAQTWEKGNVPTIRFFFSKPTTVTGKEFASTLARDIARSTPSLYPHILAALQEHDNIAACSIKEQLEWLFFAPLRSTTQKHIVVIDALDECSMGDRGKILNSLLAFIREDRSGPCPLKILLTSRPEPDITSRIDASVYSDLVRRLNFSLWPTQDPSNQEDIRLYTEEHLSDLLTAGQMDRFVARAEGLFIWAATARHFLRKAINFNDRFNILMSPRPDKSPLDILYGEIMKAASSQYEKDEQRYLREILHIICVARTPLTVKAMDELLGFDNGVAKNVVLSLSSVLSDGSKDKPVYILHPTFIEYLLTLSKSEYLVISEPAAECLLANGCLGALISRLKYDICNVIRPNTKSPMNKDVEDLDQRLQAKTTHALRYAAIHGLSHAAISIQDEALLGRLRHFFKTKLLNWIELMSFLGKVYIAMQMIHQLQKRIEDKLKHSDSAVTHEDQNWCKETINMVQPFQNVIDQSAMQTYFSALAFLSPATLIARQYLPALQELIPRVRYQRPAQTHLKTLSGHIERVASVFFASNNKQLYTLSIDGSIYHWDVETGAVSKQLQVDVGSRREVRLSPGGRHLSSRHEDGKICVWDSETSQIVGEVRGADAETCLAFSTDGSLLAFQSDDNIIKLWEFKTSTVIRELSVGSDNLATSLAFSPDASLLASGWDDCTVRLWNVASGVLIGAGPVPTNGHTDSVICLAFSPDGSILASGSCDETICLWNTVTGALVRDPLIGHDAWVWCLNFSVDGAHLASGSEDGTVRLWDIGTGVSIRVHDIPGTSSSCLAFSPNGSLLSSGYQDGTIRLWDFDAVVAEVGSVDHRICALTCLAFSPDRLRLALGLYNSTIWIWDVTNGQPLSEPLVGHEKWTEILIFSQDGEHLASGSLDGTIRLWDTASSAPIGRPLVTQTKTIRCLAFSPDGSCLASGSGNGPIELWVIATGEAKGALLMGHIKYIRQLAFSPDGRRLVSYCEGRTLRVWDVATHMAVGEPIHQHQWVFPMFFYIHNGSQFLIINKEDVWDVSSDQLRFLFKAHEAPFTPINTSSPRCAQLDLPQVNLGDSFTFALPPDVHCREFREDGGCIAYGGNKGLEGIIDCSHLI